MIIKFTVLMLLLFVIKQVQKFKVIIVKYGILIYQFKCIDQTVQYHLTYTFCALLYYYKDIIIRVRELMGFWWS